MNQRSDLAGGAGWMAFGLAVVVAAWRMDRFESMGATLYTAPGLVPGVLGLLLFGLGAALAWRGRHAAASPGQVLPGERRRIVWAVALCLGYAAVLVGRVPFTLATALFVTAFTFVFAEAGSLPRRLGVAAASGLLTTLAVVIVFERLFLVRLP